MNKKNLIPYAKDEEGSTYLMDVKKEEFVHFTKKERVKEIIEKGKLLMNSPYKKFGIDAVTAVSAVWGDYFPKVQTDHLGKKSEIGVIQFKTKTNPEYGYADEVVWHEDVEFADAHEIELIEAITLLKNTPEKIHDGNDVVIYSKYSRDKVKKLKLVEEVKVLLK